LVSKKIVLLLTLLVGLYAFALVHTAVSNSVATCHSVDSVNNYGADKATFNPDEDVYVNGSGYSPIASLCIYVVNHKATWSDGDPLTRVPNTETTVLTDGDGEIPPTVVWHKPLVPGKYDIVVDVDCDGVFDSNDLTKDALDANDLQVAAGFLVVPEYLLGTVLGLAGFFAALGVYRLSKRQQP
jgi:hypothetical protein